MKMRHRFNKVKRQWQMLIITAFAMTFAVACSKDDDGDETSQKSIQVTRILTNNITQGENPQGVVSLDDGNLLVAYPFLYQLRVIDPNSGATVSTIDGTPSFGGFMKKLRNGKVLLGANAFTDLAFDPNDPTNPNNLQPAQNHGIWSFDPATQTLTQLAQMDLTMAFAMHFEEMANGDVLVSNIIGGNIFKLDMGTNSLTNWVADPQLVGITTGSKPNAPNVPQIPVGIEGIQLEPSGNAIIGVVADYGRIVRVPINSDGTAGAVTTLFEDATNLFGLAHFVWDNNGDMIACSGFQSKIWKINMSDYSFTLLGDNTSESTVDTPAMLSKGEADQAKNIFVTNNAFVADPQKTIAPGILRIEHAL